jgi:hypothetical protein
VSDLPPPDSPATTQDDRFAVVPPSVPTAELLFRFKRLVTVMVITAIVLAVLPVPAFVPVIVLLALPMFVLIVAISANDLRRKQFVWRHVRKIWEFRHDAAYLAEAGERAREPVASGLRRAWLLLGLFVAVFLIGLVLAGLSAGAAEAIYG